MDGREYIAKLALVLVTMPNDTSELPLTDHCGFSLDASLPLQGTVICFPGTVICFPDMP